MRTTSLTGVVAPAVFPLILLALSGSPAAAQEKTNTSVTTAPLPPAATTDWTWASLGIDFPDEPAAEPAEEEAPAPYLSASTPKGAAAVKSATGVNSRVSRTTNTNGTSAVTAAGSFKDWNYTEFGMDMSLAPAQQPGTANTPYATSGAANVDGSGAVAWAKTTVPAMSNVSVWQKGTVEMRVDPLQDQSRVGTTFSRQWSLMDSVTATISDAYAVVMGNKGSEQWETGKTASVNFAQTGTSLSVGAASNSENRTWAPTVSASQNLLGPVTVTTSVAENGDSLNKSVTAGFRQKW